MERLPTPPDLACAAEAWPPDADAGALVEALRSLLERIGQAVIAEALP